MHMENTIRAPRALLRGGLWNLVIGAASVSVGFALFSISPEPRMLPLVFLGVAALLALLIYPELALALYVVIGDVKGDDRVAALLPWDLTLALGGVLIAGIILNFLRKKRSVAMPPAYFLLVALLALMVASLSYTPVLDAGLEKLGRFLTVTGIVIVAPFFLLGTAQAMKRFLIGFAVVAFVICAYSLGSLGGSGPAGDAEQQHDRLGAHRVRADFDFVVWRAAAAAISETHFDLSVTGGAGAVVDRVWFAGSGVGAGWRDFAELIFSSRPADGSGMPGSAGICGDSVRQYSTGVVRISGDVGEQHERERAAIFSRGVAELRLEIAAATSAAGSGDSGVSLLLAERGIIQLAAQHIPGNVLRAGFAGRNSGGGVVRQRDSRSLATAERPCVARIWRCRRCARRCWR